jgi:hypothetical protein
VLDSVTNFVGNIDIISFGYSLPYNLLILVIFISGILFFWYFLGVLIFLSNGFLQEI